MSLPFFSLLKKLTMVSKSKETVFFKSGGRCRVSVPTTATFLHVSAGPADMDFDGDEICVASLMEAENDRHRESMNVDLESKLIQTAAGFLGKQLES